MVGIKFKTGEDFKETAAGAIIGLQGAMSQDTATARLMILHIRDSVNEKGYLTLINGFARSQLMNLNALIPNDLKKNHVKKFLDILDEIALSEEKKKAKGGKNHFFKDQSSLFLFINDLDKKRILKPEPNDIAANKKDNGVYVRLGGKSFLVYPHDLKVLEIVGERHRPNKAEKEEVRSKTVDAVSLRELLLESFNKKKIISKS